MTPARIATIRAAIAERCPQGVLMLKANQKNHVYGNVRTGEEFISVTSKLHIINNPIFQQWRMKQALQYVKDHSQEPDVLDKAALYPEEQFALAGERGSRVHGLISDYFKSWIACGLQGPPIAEHLKAVDEQDKHIWGAIRSFDKWVTNQPDLVPLATELQTWSSKHRVAGTLDLLALVGGRLTIIDFKTSNNLRDDYHLQVGGYFGCLREQAKIIPKLGVIVRLEKGYADYQEETITNLVTMWKQFLTASSLYDVMAQLGKERRQRVTIKL